MIFIGMLPEKKLSFTIEDSEYNIMIGTESPVKIYGLDKDPNYSAVCHLCANKLNIMLVYN